MYTSNGSTKPTQCFKAPSVDNFERQGGEIWSKCQSNEISWKFLDFESETVQNWLRLQHCFFFEICSCELEKVTILYRLTFVNAKFSDAFAMFFVKIKDMITWFT